MRTKDRDPSLLVLEMNELCPPLMARFIAEGRLPNFARLRRESEVFVTDAGEDPPYLEPWIQWVTVHTGLGYEQHRVFHLDEGDRLRKPRIWDVASAQGRRVWVCGSMNVRYDRPVRGMVLPDPWTTRVGPYPEGLTAFHRFVQRHVLEYTRDRVPLSAAEVARFGAYMATNGLSVRTVRSIVEQLVEERAPHRRWKRAAVLDKLQFDVFAHHHRKLRPHLSTFFVNSTAHFQHMYWRYLEPGMFAPGGDGAERRAYEGAIRFGYEEMDRLVGRVLDLVDERTTVVLATALSQQPCLKYETEGGKAYCRVRDFDKLLEFTGVRGRCSASPVMSEEFHLRFENEDDAIDAERRLRQLRVGDRPGMKVAREGDGIFAGPVAVSTISPDAVLSHEGAGTSVPFFEMFYRVDGKKSGMHHRDGLLWIRSPSRTHAEAEAKVPLTAVAPTLLERIGVGRPKWMREPIRLSS